MTDLPASITSCIETVDRLFNRSSIESIGECRQTFGELVENAPAIHAINNQLRRLKADASYVGDWRPNHLILHRGSGFIVSVANFNAPQRYIHSSPFYGFYAPLGGQPLLCETYEPPEHYRNDVFDPSVKIVSTGIQQIASGGVLELRTDRTVYDIKVSQPQLVLKLTTSAYHTLEWLFSRDTLFAWQANDADLRSTQLRVGAYLLGRLGDQSSIEALRQLAAHPNHSARWAAIQALGRLSRSEGLAQLEKAVDDRHPHIRRAAQKALGASKKAG